MSRYQDTRRRWLASLRRFGNSLLDLLASTSGMYLIPPPSLSGPPPEPVSASQDVASAPLTDDERRAWERLVRELGGESKSEEGRRRWWSRR